MADDDVWTIDGANGLSGAGGAEGPRSSTGVLRHWDGVTWTTARPPLVAKDVDGRASGDVWVVGSRQGQAAAAHWNGRSWSLNWLPKLPALHRDQISELIDVAVDDSGDVAAVGWVAWVCGVEEEDVTYCGKKVMMRMRHGRWTYELRGDLGYGSDAQLESDGRGGLWLLYDASEWASGCDHFTDGRWVACEFPKGPLGHTKVARMIRQPGSTRGWAVGVDTTEREEPPYRGGVIWRF